MKLTFYRPKTGILNNFLETQIQMAELNGVEVAFKYLDAATASELQNIINECYLKNADGITHYSYVFSDDNDKPLAAIQKPLDYMDINSYFKTLKEVAAK